MRLTTKGRYAVTAMLDLALNSQNVPVALADISSRQGISLSYLEQLFSRLRRAALVSSVRGPGGGYRLARAPEAVSVADIVNAVNETIDATKCGSNSNCQRGEICLTHHLWMGLSEQIYEFLSTISLQALITDDQVQAIATRQCSRLESQSDPKLRLTQDS